MACVRGTQHYCVLRYSDTEVGEGQKKKRGGWRCSMPGAAANRALDLSSTDFDRLRKAACHLAWRVLTRTRNDGDGRCSCHFVK